VSGELQRTEFEPRTELAVSPRVGVLWHAHDLLSLRASGYRAFRAPTLNELYRPFQVGTVLTAANAELGPELLSGFEGGLELAGSRAVVVRTTGFWNYLERPITNVTLATPREDGAQRERQNLGSVLVRGVESALELRIERRWTAILAYTLAASKVRDAGSMNELRDKQLPQAPRHRASALLSFDDPRWFSATVQLRGVGKQYEDDLNTLPMAGYLVVDVSASWRLWWKLDLFVAVENLLDEQYLVGRAGVDTIGQPLLARIGLRVRDPAIVR
jgi:iron complex outermembrane recepter protein